MESQFERAEKILKLLEKAIETACEKIADLSLEKRKLEEALKEIRLKIPYHGRLDKIYDLIDLLEKWRNE